MHRPQTLTRIEVAPLDRLARGSDRLLRRIGDDATPELRRVGAAIASALGPAR